MARKSLPDERWGEEVVAILHLHHRTALGEAEVVAFARERLVAYKAPTRVFFHAGPLPRNAPNKVLKSVLKAELQAQFQGGDNPPR